MKSFINGLPHPLDALFAHLQVLGCAKPIQCRLERVVTVIRHHQGMGIDDGDVGAGMVRIDGVAIAGERIIALYKQGGYFRLRAIVVKQDDIAHIQALACVDEMLYVDEHHSLEVAIAEHNAATATPLTQFYPAVKITDVVMFD